ncbi:MAG: hypothetical protein A3K19_23355 [Lentisphaerae bacterium RIFOXYB12_FULL_65_16]|nr:MAG: hypothetical protein A3K18_26310 [Lentisphaerae bacterium RIFOXYA12_64_32]OGV87502.1 MAG: hypothetical protein A3K19_23355 [Lentisphaerae bacterium RIFOXYB12_FULL_65_16]
MVTLKDIARHVGMAPSTVSAVLAGKSYCYVSAAKKEQILAAARELGYLPNQMSRALKGLPTHTVGVIASLANVPITSRLLFRISDLLWDAGLHVMMGDSRGEAAREGVLVQEFLARGVDGLIIHNVHPAAELEVLVGGRAAYVTLYHTHPDSNVMADRCAGGRLATEHLLGHGHRKIGFAANSLDGTGAAKFEGYRAALAEAGAEFAPGFCVNGFDGRSRAGWRGVWNAIERCGVTAFFASDDFQAAALIQALPRKGVRVPQDVAVIGFDGLEFGEFLNPALTTVHQPVEEQAQKVVALLQAALPDKSHPTGQHVIEPQLLVRESCGCGKRRKK